MVHPHSAIGNPIIMASLSSLSLNFLLFLWIAFLQVNFRTIGRALLVLFRLSTAAGWNDILTPLIVQPPDCDPDFQGLSNGNCGYPIGAPVYCVTFTFFTFLIILNLYVAIILENYVDVSEDSIFEDDIDAFYSRWAKFDPRASQFIHIDKVVILVKGLSGALKIETADSLTLSELNLPVYEDHSIHCLDLLKGLVKIRLGIVQENEAMSQVGYLVVFALALAL